MKSYTPIIVIPLMVLTFLSLLNSPYTLHWYVIIAGLLVVMILFTWIKDVGGEKLTVGTQLSTLFIILIWPVAACCYTLNRIRRRKVPDGKV